MIKIFLLIYFIFIFISCFLFLVEEAKGVGFSITPRDIYDSNDFNMFGAWCVFVIFLMVNPLYILLKFLYWMFHVGRK